MERLRTLAIVMSLGAGCQAVFADDPAPTAEVQAPASPAEPAPAVRPEPPVAPKKYLETGALLFNRKRYELAAKYLDAAQMYRDRLTPNEQVVLDEFRDQLDHYVQDRKRAEEGVTATGNAADPAVVAASTSAPPALDMSGKRPEPDPDEAAPGGDPKAPDAPASTPADPTAKPAKRVVTEILRDNPDAKQEARWQLYLAREQIVKKQFDAAEKIVARVRTMDIKWGYFDDTPDKVSDAIAKARARDGLAPKSVAGTGTATGQPRDRRTARAMLREARLAIDANQLDKASAIAREVRSWDLRYSPFDDTPDKVAVAAADARRRVALRNAELSVKTYAEAEPTVPR